MIEVQDIPNSEEELTKKLKEAYDYADSEWSGMQKYFPLFNDNKQLFQNIKGTYETSKKISDDLLLSDNAEKVNLSTSIANNILDIIQLMNRNYKEFPDQDKTLSLPIYNKYKEIQPLALDLRESYIYYHRELTGEDLSDSYKIRNDLTISKKSDLPIYIFIIGGIVAMILIKKYK